MPHIDCVMCATALASAEDTVIHRGEHWVAQGAMAVPGWILLYPPRHNDGVWELTDDEAVEYGRLLPLLTGAIRAATGAERVYVIYQGEVAAHFHTMLMARGAQMPATVRGMIPLLADAENFTDPVGAEQVVRQLRRALHP